MVLAILKIMMDLLKYCLPVILLVLIWNTDAHANKQSSLEIFSPEESLNFYNVPNVGDFVRDAPVNPQEGYLPYARKADAALYALIKGRAEDFLFFVSPNLMEQYGQAKITQNISAILVPYFHEFDSFREDMVVSPVRDRWGNEGYSFKQAFVTTNGKTKELTVQVVIEDGVLAVSDITPHTK